MNVYNCCWEVQEYDKHNQPVAWNAVDAFQQHGIPIMAQTLEQAVSIFNKLYANRSLKQVYALASDVLITPEVHQQIRT